MYKKYNALTRQLYGDSKELVGTARVAAGNDRSFNVIKNKGLSERQEQLRVVKWLNENGIAFYHVPNGGKREIREAVMFHQMGVIAGVPDLCILGAMDGYHGLYIEIKRQNGGKLSAAQIRWGKILTEKGYLWKEGKGADECIKIVRDYFKI
jgi:hypothetical protein